jgi:branched-chain amino acid transport system ATP-binding protein
MNAIGIRGENLRLLEIKNVTKEFDGLRALEDVSLAMSKGEILGLIGPNGAGKTTLFNIVSGTYPVTSGEVFFNGVNITSVRDYKRPHFGIARTFQNIKLFPELNVIENVMLGRHSKTRSNLVHVAFHLPLHGKEEEESRKKVIDILDFLEIRQLAPIRAGDLPYGQQRLVELARALALEPSLLLLDEPAAGLNSHEVEELEKKLRVSNESGISILCVEHNMKLIMSLSDNIVVLNYGKKIASGSPEEISNNHLVIEAYLGKGSA